jgi:PKD repeat protein/C-terminal processing protease CtpA/Prc
MKKSIIKKLLLMLLMLGASFEAITQVPDEVYYERLFYLCKTWGHAKYYHTRIAAGLVNWDNELLTAVSGAKTAPDAAAFNAILLQMLNNAGPMGTSNVTLPDVPDSLNNNLDLTWMQSTFFSEPVRAILIDIKDKFRPQTNVYVGPGSAPVLTNDSLYYGSEDYPSEEKRMLAMFRFWNQVHYFFPYKQIMNQNWDATLVEFIPSIAQAEDAISFNLAFKEFTTRINDAHGFYYSPVYNNWRGNYYPPFLVRYIENEMVITKVLPGVTEIAAGDVILEIDGENIYALRNSLIQYVHGSNPASIERNLNDLIMYGNAGTFDIIVQNGSGTHTATLTRNTENYNNLLIDSSPIWKDTLINGSCSYGIVDMGRLEIAQVADMFADLWNTEAIIFDIRNYPQGALWTMVDYLFPAPIHIANFTKNDDTYPGRMYWIHTTISTGTSNPYNGKIILLFDERTQSHAEYTCMGLEQFPGAIKIGSQTAGADGNVTREYLTGKIYTYFTGLGTYYPDYSPTQRVGIVPDIEIHPTIAGIRAGIDEVMEVALNCALLESDYCTSSGCNSSTEWIQKIVLGTYVNNSGSDIGYGDFTDTPLEIENGQTYSLSVTPGFSGRSRREYCRVWIDYNMDGDFSDSGEQVFAANGIKGPASGNISIPAGITGETRMRVSLKYNATPTSCENFAYGEVEDYTLNFITPPPPPPVADFSGTPLSVVMGGIVQFADLSANAPTSWLWTFEGGDPGTSDEQNPSITYNTTGTYDVTLFVSNAAGSDVLTLENYITVTQPGSCQDNYEPNEIMGSAKVIPVNTDVFALISSSTDTDWFKFTTTGGAKNIKITLTNLPADYNIKLYKSDGTLVGSSMNTGVISELIIYNTNKAGTYNINVYGNAGAFDPNDCYTLRAEVSSIAFKSIEAESMEPDVDEELTVYPNPSNSTFNLKLQTASNDLMNLRLYDISGRILGEYQSLPPTEVITIGENLEIGVYIVVVRQGTLQKIARIAKVR